MSVELSPAGHLDFHRPLTQIVKVTLSVSNTNHQPVAFKVKTTAPKNFCVRPNSGRIEPGERVEVQVLLQGLKEEPAPDFKCRDKFLVQSALITPERELKALSELWSAIEADAKSGKEGVIHEQKIRCVYLPPLEDTPIGNTSAGDLTADETSPPAPAGQESSFAGPSPSKYETVRGLPPVDTSSAHAPASDRAVSNGNGRDISSSPVPQTAVEPAKESILPTSLTEAKNAVSNAAASALSGVPPTSSTPSSSGSLEKELAQAKAEIERLKKLLAQKEQEVSSGLRQRNVGKSAESNDGPVAGVAQAVQMQEGGLPLQTVAILCAGVFVATWLFF